MTTVSKARAANRLQLSQTRGVHVHESLTWSRRATGTAIMWPPSSLTAKQISATLARGAIPCVLRARIVTVYGTDHRRWVF
eukprot:6182801-Pleurochrysis_carterae.AAC.1